MEEQRLKCGGRERQGWNGKVKGRRRRERMAVEEKRNERKIKEKYGRKGKRRGNERKKRKEKRKKECVKKRD